MKRGIDISFNQPLVKWDQLKTDFVMLRSGYGREVSQEDVTFNMHFKNAKKYGIPVGCYHYSYATSVEGAKAEAKACLEIIKGKQFEYPIAYDIEEARTFKKGKAVVSDIARAFCSELEKAGYYVCIYASKSNLQTFFEPDVLKKYDIWVAHWNNECAYTGNYGIWQYTSSGHIDGINGNVDMDIAFKDYPAIMKEYKLNGFKDPTHPPDRGYWVKGDTDTEIYCISLFMRKVFPAYTSQKAVSHYFNQELVKSIREFQKRTNIGVDGLIGPETFNELRKYGYRR